MGSETSTYSINRLKEALLNFLQQKMTEELKTLIEECRANSCIEHATGIVEEVKAPENLSKKISNMSLTGAEKKVLTHLFCLSFPF